MRYQNIVVEVHGEEVTIFSRRLIVAVPDDATTEEIEELKCKVLDDVPDAPEWQFEESEGVESSDYRDVILIGEANRNKAPNARLARNAQGKLVMTE